MFRRLAHVKEEGSPLSVDHGHPNFLERRKAEVRRTRVMRSSAESFAKRSHANLAAWIA
jgi:hypothetical protein